MSGLPLSRLSPLRMPPRDALAFWSRSPVNRSIGRPSVPNVMPHRLCPQILTLLIAPSLPLPRGP